MNQTLFLILNASETPPAVTMLVARFFAQYAIALIPCLLVLGWLRGSFSARLTMLQAAGAGVLALLFALAIGQAWPTPRPFMTGLGHPWLAHAADASFPSDHLTLWWPVSFSLLLHRRSSTIGAALAFAGLAVAWARIYLGVPFPADMAGAAEVGLLAAALAQRARPLLAQWVLPIGQATYRWAFAPAIVRGWVRH
jgi:undecaprenyl-diphosphatase